MTRPKRALLLGLGLGLLALAGCAVTPAPEYGSVAFDPTTRDYGLSWGQASPTAARREAIGSCGAGCAILEDFGPGECATLASRPQSQPVVGIGATRAAAKARAGQACGADCAVVPPECNG